MALPEAFKKVSGFFLKSKTSKKIHLSYVYLEFHSNTYLYHVHPGTGVTDSGELPHGCWVLNCGPL